MTISSLLLHCDDDADYPDRARIALDLAQRYEAHLTAVYTNPTSDAIPETYGRISARGYLSEELHMARQKARDARKLLLEACANKGVSCEWVWEQGPLLSVLTNYSLHADLAIVSQTPPASLEEILFDYMPDHLPMTGSCPVLILPQGFTGELPLRHPLIAWKSEREASHAVRGVLPILRAAETVTVISVDASEKEKALTDRFLQWLSLHRVTINLEQRQKKGRKIATVITETAQEKNCDVMVMGGYGQSRLRELVMGGVTRSFLKKMPLPILMGH